MLKKRHKLSQSDDRALSFICIRCSMYVSCLRRKVEKAVERISICACILERTPMPTRSEIQDTLAASQEKVFAYFEGLSPEDLERPCTVSGVPGEAPWSAKDHFAHLTANEEGIQTLLRLSLTGESLPENLTSMSPEERLAWSN